MGILYLPERDTKVGESEHALSRKVSPREPLPPTEAEKERARVSWKFGGCAWLSIGLYFLFALAGAIVEQFLPALVRDNVDLWALILLFGPTGLALSITLGSASYRTRQNLRDLMAIRERDVLREASDLAKRASYLLDQAPHLEGRLLSLVKSAQEMLQQAESDYGDNAFGPFWDAIEKSAITLYTLRRTVMEIEHTAQSYFESLRGREHTFPPYPPPIRSIPGLPPTIEHYRRLLRLAQTNFQFAVIWEHRKTRETIIEGFRSLGDAIERVTFGLQESVEQLHTSVRSLRHHTA